jgi:excisionase family DNA binding protein
MVVKNEGDLMWTTKQVSEMFNVHEETVRRWIRTGELYADYKDGKSYRIEQSSLNKFINKMEKERGNSISKMATVSSSILGSREGTGNVFSKLNEVEAAVVANHITKMRRFDQIPDEPDELTINYLKYLIQSRKRDKEIYEIEHRLLLFNIDNEIAKYEFLLQEKLNEKEGGNNE